MADNVPVFFNNAETVPVDLALAEDLQALHNLINAITPIEGLSLTDSGPAEVCYTTDVTAAQEAEVAAVIATWELLRAKNARLREIAADWQTQISAGWATPYGWKLGLTPQDITLLTGAFILAKEAASMGLTDMPVIVDTDGGTHSLSLQDLTQLMLMYGQARAEMSAIDAARREAVKNATTLEALQAI